MRNVSAKCDKLLILESAFHQQFRNWCRRRRINEEGEETIRDTAFRLKIRLAGRAYVKRVYA